MTSLKKKSIMKSEGGDTGPWLQVIRRLRLRNKTGLVDSISRKQNRNFKKKNPYRKCSENKTLHTTREHELFLKMGKENKEDAEV